MMSNFEDKRRAEAQRVADQDHRDEIESDVVSAFHSELGLRDLSFDIMYAIRDGKIDHVKIEY